jgi:hypothetical protein
MACLLPWRSSPRALRSALPSSLAAALPQLGSAQFGAHLPASQPSVFPGLPARIAPNFQRRGRPLCSSPSSSYGAPTLLPYFFLMSTGRSLCCPGRRRASLAPALPWPDQPLARAGSSPFPWLASSAQRPPPPASSSCRRPTAAHLPSLSLFLPWPSHHFPQP